MRAFLSSHAFQRHSRRDRGAGQALVEFALTLPILILLLVGILDLARLYFAYITVVNASREGARYAAANPAAIDIATHARNEAEGSIINPSNLTVGAPSCPGGCTAGNPVQITVSYNFQLITSYIFGGGTLPLRATSQMQIFGQ